MMRKLGVAASEVASRTAPANAHRFQVWRNNNGMATSPVASHTNTLFDAATLSEYTAVVFGCDGGSGFGGYSASMTAADRTAQRNFVDAGGRVFFDHWNGYYALVSAQWPVTTTFTGGDTPAGLPAAGRVQVGPSEGARLPTQGRRRRRRGARWAPRPPAVVRRAARGAGTSTCRRATRTRGRGSPGTRGGRRWRARRRPA